MAQSRNVLNDFLARLLHLYSFRGRLFAFKTFSLCEKLGCVLFLLFTKFEFVLFFLALSFGPS